MNKKIIIGIVVVLLVAGGIYWYAESQHNGGMPYSETTNTSSTTTRPSPAASASVPIPTPIITIKTSATLGKYLAATNGMTLYTYSKDKADASNCIGSCAISWPPYTILATRVLTAGANINGDLSNINRGTSFQLTYNGMPLYFWSLDSKPGDTTGNNVNGFVVAKP
jgi:predicted lipoprotein with Yx(FWY)xxD motif